MREFYVEGTTLFFTPPVYVPNYGLVNREVFRPDCWKSSEIKRIAKDLNSQQLPESQDFSLLSEKVSGAIRKELQYQCDEWNRKYCINT